MKKKSILDIAILLTFGALILLFWKSCDPGPNHDDDKKTVDSLIRENNSLNSELKSFKDSVQAASAVILDKIDSLSLAKAAADLQARKSSENASKWAKLYDLAKAGRDTLAQLASCDSLRSEIDTLILAFEVNGKITDSIIENQKTIISLDKLIIKSQESAIVKKDQTISEMAEEFNSVYNDYKAQEKKQKRGRWITRIAIVAAGVAGVLIAK